MYAFLAAAALPPQQCVFPSFTLLCPLMCCVFGRQGRCYPPRAGSSWRVTDGNVRRRQTWRRLTAAYSSAPPPQTNWEACATEPRPLPKKKKEAVSLLRNLLGDCCQPLCTEEWGGVTECQRLRSVQPCITEADYFLLTMKARVNLWFPIKRDHTANVKYTLSVLNA